MILYVKNPKDDTRKLLELIKEYGKVVGYKINTQKSLAFLYANNEKSELEQKIHNLYESTKDPDSQSSLEKEE